MVGSVLARRAGAAAALTVTAATLPIAIAQAAPAESAQFCATLLGAGKDSAGHSVVVKQSCSSSSAAAAAAALPAGSTQLVTWYAEAGWKGTYADIYGSDGTCDANGYSFRPNYAWELQLSSIRGYGNCTSVDLLNLSGSRQDYHLSVSLDATPFNDSVAWMNVYRGPS
jgi:hypothetical protein